LLDSLGGDQEFDDDEGAEGLWMSGNDTLDSPTTQVPGEPPSIEFVPPARPLAKAELPPLEGQSPEETAIIEFPARRITVAAEAPADEAPAQPTEPAPPSATPEAPPQAEVESAPAAAPDPFAQVQTVAASEPASGGGALSDALSMFKDTGPSSELAHLTGDLEDVPAQELLTEARAVLDLLGGPKASGE
jgi:hypothetical protein